MIRRLIVLLYACSVLVGGAAAVGSALLGERHIRQAPQAAAPERGLVYPYEARGRIFFVSRSHHMMRSWLHMAIVAALVTVAATTAADIAYRRSGRNSRSNVDVV